VWGRRTRRLPSSSSFTCPALRHILHAGQAPADRRQGAVGCNYIRKLHSARVADLVVIKPELHQSERQWASALYCASAAFCTVSKKNGEFFSPGKRKQVSPQKKHANVKACSKPCSACG